MDADARQPAPIAETTEVPAPDRARCQHRIGAEAAPNGMSAAAATGRDARGVVCLAGESPCRYHLRPGGGPVSLRLSCANEHVATAEPLPARVRPPEELLAWNRERARLSLSCPNTCPLTHQQDSLWASCRQGARSTERPQGYPRTTRC